MPRIVPDRIEICLVREVRKLTQKTRWQKRVWWMHKIVALCDICYAIISTWGLWIKEVLLPLCPLGLFSLPHWILIMKLSDLYSKLQRGMPFAHINLSLTISPHWWNRNNYLFFSTSASHLLLVRDIPPTTFSVHFMATWRIRSGQWWWI